jgi:outer membrane lipoprotein SlyB
MISGCTASTEATYDPKDVGRAAETASGSIVASRLVDVRGEASNTGALAGGALGAAGSGLAFESGWAALIGAVVGAGVGYATERTVNARQGVEYVIDLDDGRTITLVQNRGGDDAPIEPGTLVLVQFGGKYNRVIADPRRGHAPGRSGWVDPDRHPAAAAVPPPPPALSPSSSQQPGADSRPRFVNPFDAQEPVRP